MEALRAYGPALEITCVRFCYISRGYTGQPLFHVGGVSTRTAVVSGLAAPVGWWDWTSATRGVSAIMVLGTSR